MHAGRPVPVLRRRRRIRGPDEPTKACNDAFARPPRAGGRRRAKAGRHAICRPPQSLACGLTRCRAGRRRAVCTDEARGESAPKWRLRATRGLSLFDASEHAVDELEHRAGAAIRRQVLSAAGAARVAGTAPQLAKRERGVRIAARSSSAATRLGLSPASRAALKAGCWPAVAPAAHRGRDR